MEVKSTNDKGADKSPLRTEIEVSSVDERDVQALARLGKKPILKVCSSL